MSVDRDLGFIKWSDKYGKLENMKSQEFKIALRQEKETYNKVLEKIPESLIKAWSEEFDRLPKTYDNYYEFHWLRYTIKVCAHNRLRPTIRLEINSSTKLLLPGVNSFGKTSSRFWYIKDSTDGKEEQSLFILDEHLELLKEIKNVSEDAVSTAYEIFYTEQTKKFWSNKLFKINNGLSISKLYEEHEEKYVLSVLKPKNQDAVFLLRASAIYQDIGQITIDGVNWLDRGFGIKNPVDSKTLAYDSYFKHDGVKINYPPNNYLNSAFIMNHQYYFIFKHDVFNSVFRYQNNTWVTIQEPLVAEIISLPETNLLLVGQPHLPDKITAISNKLTLMKQIAGPAYRLTYDYENIPWFIVSPNTSLKPRGLIICGYGSYGMSLRKNQQNLWIPWLERGYAIANMCVRGGSENGEHWWDESRTAVRRKIGIDDFCWGIKYLQKKLDYDATNTIIYGRSAGGFLVTATANKMLNEIGVVYAAKPFTDVLRTVTNRNMTQVMQESEEFGYVANDPVGFMEIARVSPYENIPENPKRNPAVILTGGVSDPEVELYMPLKFVKQLHDAGWKNAVIRVAEEGHFTNQDNLGEAYDAALCEYFLLINSNGNL